MKRVYTSPDLIEYGRMAQLTQGGSGPQTDLIVDNTYRVISVNVSDCSSNATGCFHISS